uniref:Acetyl-coenzyme A synthetase N-terminal domain-containing protein n=1 Tax=Myripristis murdjan TaxID=586833 RepID=A0A668APH2_9TELE
MPFRFALQLPSRPSRFCFCLQSSSISNTITKTPPSIHTLCIRMNEGGGVWDHSGLYEFSVGHTDSFWGAAARHRLTWISPFRSVQDCDLRRGTIRWFEGGKLNVSVNCLDRHVHTFPDRVALIWERDEPGTEAVLLIYEIIHLYCILENTHSICSAFKLWDTIIRSIL